MKLELQRLKNISTNERNVRSKYWYECYNSFRESVCMEYNTIWMRIEDNDRTENKRKNIEVFQMWCRRRKLKIRWTGGLMR